MAATAWAAEVASAHAVDYRVPLTAVELAMDVKEAVKVAREYAQVVFEGETIRIEEVWFEDAISQWCITIGLQRPESYAPSGLGGLASGRPIPSSRTHYKTIRISDDSKEIKSVRNHDKMPVST